MKKVLESDWKIYSKLIPVWRDRYLQSRNEELLALLSEKARSPTEKFWEAKKQIDGEAKILDECLGYFSRSKMEMSILMMIRHGMIQDEELEQFSESLRQDLFAFTKMANNGA